MNKWVLRTRLNNVLTYPNVSFKQNLSEVLALSGILSFSWNKIIYPTFDLTTYSQVEKHHVSNVYLKFSLAHLAMIIEDSSHSDYPSKDALAEVCPKDEEKGHQSPILYEDPVYKEISMVSHSWR